MGTIQARNPEPDRSDTAKRSSSVQLAIVTACLFQASDPTYAKFWDGYVQGLDWFFSSASPRREDIAIVVKETDKGIRSYDADVSKWHRGFMTGMMGKTFSEAVRERYKPETQAQEEQTTMTAGKESAAYVFVTSLNKIQETDRNGIYAQDDGTIVLIDRIVHAKTEAVRRGLQEFAVFGVSARGLNAAGAIHRAENDPHILHVRQAHVSPGYVYLVAIFAAPNTGGPPVFQLAGLFSAPTIRSADGEIHFINQSIAAAGLLKTHDPDNAKFWDGYGQGLVWIKNPENRCQEKIAAVVAETAPGTQSVDADVSQWSRGFITGMKGTPVQKVVKER